MEEVSCASISLRRTAWRRGCARRGRDDPVARQRSVDGRSAMSLVVVDRGKCLSIDPPCGTGMSSCREGAWTGPNRFVRQQPSQGDGSLCKGTAPFMPLQPKVLEPWGTLFSTRLTGFRGTWPAGKWPPSSCPDFGLNQQKYPQNERKPPRQAGAVGSCGCVYADETEFRLGFVGGPSRPPARSAPPYREPAPRT